MALIFERFDTADKKVRDAVIELANPVKPKKKGGGYDKKQMAKFAQSARVLFDYAAAREPGATIADLAECVMVFGQDAKKAGHLDEHAKPYLAKWRFEAIFPPRRKKTGKPEDDEPSMTLAEMSVLLHAGDEPKPRQGDAR